jgi:hypothetical protein
MIVESAGVLIIVTRIELFETNMNESFSLWS